MYTCIERERYRYRYRYRYRPSGRWPGRESAGSRRAPSPSSRRGTLIQITTILMMIIIVIMIVIMFMIIIIISV